MKYTGQPPKDEMKHTGTNTQYYTEFGWIQIQQTLPGGKWSTMQAMKKKKKKVYSRNTPVKY